MKLKIPTICQRVGFQSTAVLMLTSVLCLFGFTACAQLKSWFTQPGAVEQLAPATTNLVTIITTNIINLPAQTNAATGQVTPPTFNGQLGTNVTAVVQPATYFTNLALAPVVQNAITTAD